MVMTMSKKITMMISMMMSMIRIAMMIHIIMIVDHRNHLDYNYHHYNHLDDLAAFQAMLAECVEAGEHFWGDKSPIAHLVEVKNDNGDYDDEYTMIMIMMIMVIMTIMMMTITGHLVLELVKLPPPRGEEERPEKK